jgi:hypothetical protein
MPEPVPPAITNLIRTLYVTAAAGSTPERIWPALMPGSATPPFEATGVFHAVLSV